MRMVCLLADNEFIPAAVPNSEWRHERASVMMLDHLIKENHLPFTDGCNTHTQTYVHIHVIYQLCFFSLCMVCLCIWTYVCSDEISWLHELINPSDVPRSRNHKTFLYDIVANARNSVDVDKFDYLSRDAHNLGMKIRYTPIRRKNCPSLAYACV